MSVFVRIMGLWLCWLGLAAPVQAAGMAHNWYVVEIPVVDQGESERRKALRTGLKQILVQISGQSDVTGNAQVLEALGNPEVYLQEFSYGTLSEAEKAVEKARVEAQNRQKAKAAGSASTGKLLPIPVPALKIKAHFSSDALRTLLRNAGLPLWPSRRPSVLAWVVVDDSATRHTVSQLPAEQTVLTQEANRRGLSLVMPMNDLTDQLALGVEQLMLLDEAAIREASQRYGESAVMAGRVTKLSGTEWQGSWRFLMADTIYALDVTTEDVSDFLALGVDGAVQQLLLRYAIAADSVSAPVTVEITGISNVARYADALRLLKNIESVKSVAVTEVNQQTLHCSVDTEGSVAILQALIGLENSLLPEEPVIAADAIAAPVLRYRFVSP